MRGWKRQVISTPSGCLPTTVLRGKIAHRLTRPVGRPSKTKVKRFYEDFQYQAQRWDKPRRVIAKIEWHPGELFPRLGFIVTNLPMEPDEVTRFYNRRGTAEQHIKEGKVRLPLDAAVMQAVPRQRGPAAAARAGLQPGNISALHRTARGDGRLVTDEPSAQADQDRGPRRAPRPRHHVSTCRGRGDRPDGACHPRRDPPPSSASDMYVTAIPPQTERTRQDRSVQLAEKCPWRTWARPFCGPVCFNLSSSWTAVASCRPKHLTHRPDQATLPLTGRLLGECPFTRSEMPTICGIYTAASISRSTCYRSTAVRRTSPSCSGTCCQDRGHPVRCRSRLNQMAA
jgi:hypothetical protein